MSGAPCGWEVARCEPLGRYRGRRRKTPVIRLAATGQTEEVVATMAGLEREG